MEFPALVYRCPGTNQRPGGTYNYLSVQDEQQHVAALAEGWFETLPEAIAGTSAQINPNLSLPAVPENPSPTRIELEQKATELEIKFDGRTSDKKLSDLISATLEQ